MSYVHKDIEIFHEEGLKYLQRIDNDSIDLILTDPPYKISKKTGFGKFFNKIKKNEQNQIKYVKNDNDWEKYQLNNNIRINKNNEAKQKERYKKTGTIYGKKYCIRSQYGDWDTEFTMTKLAQFIKEFYKKLKKGGTLIIFFDLWKITILRKILEENNFKQIRFIEWIKTNPLPLNSKINYLTNCREIAIVAVKYNKNTFNSSYDVGIYKFPTQTGKIKCHPTQKNLKLFETLIKKHSKINDTVLDTFLGGGTTAIASRNTQRKFKGCEMSKKYFNKIISMLIQTPSISIKNYIPPLEKIYIS